MKDLWKTLRLAGYVLVLPMLATAAVSAFQWTNQQDAQIPANQVSAPVSMTVASTRNHAIKLDQFGNLMGRIWAANSNSGTQTGAANLEVTLMQNGKVIANAHTGGAGDFNIKNVQPGVYSLIAHGESGLSIHAIRVVSFEDPSVPFIEPFETVAITQNTKKVQQILGKSKQNASNPSGRSTLSNINVLSGNRVALDRNGNLFGKVIPSIHTTQIENRVVIMQSGKIIADVQSQPDGSFVIEGLKPGHYDFVSSGQAGNAAFGFEAIAARSPFRQTSYQPAQQDGTPDTLDTPLANPNDVIVVNDEFIAGPFQGGGGFGGGFGGGGFGGGFGGFGGGLGVSPEVFWGGAALTIGIIALADNNNGGTPPPNSPNN